MYQWSKSVPDIEIIGLVQRVQAAAAAAEVVHVQSERANGLPN